MTAADELNQSALEDLEQGTVNRCQQLLYKIGIKPIIPPSSIRKALLLSRGNDLAFLYFLKEIYYGQSENVNISGKGGLYVINIFALYNLFTNSQK